ncbi:MAG: PTS sugar transporter subunit IIA [Eubacterium sp.]|nr:PTS sugar transporter subunit IIA [Eubacterium sp.]
MAVHSGAVQKWHYVIMPNFILFSLNIMGIVPYNIYRKRKLQEINTKKCISRQKKEEICMLFKKKKEEAAPEKKELLYRENIRVNCEPDTQEQVIRTVGQMLVDSGYVDQPYVDAMIEREQSFSTFMGNGLALPHGVEAAKKEIKASGIAVMTFPKGIDWGGNEVHVVIGIAGVGEEHLEILSVIADKMLDDSAAEKLMAGDVDTVYQILAGKE